MVGACCGFVSRTLALIITPLICLCSIFVAATCWVSLVKDGDTLSTAQKMVDGIVGFVLTVYAIITVFGFFGLCLGNIKATRLYMHAITSYLVSFGILGLVRIIVFATNKVSFTSSCTGSNDDCSKAFTIALVIVIIIYIITMILIGTMIFLLRSSLVTMEGGLNKTSISKPVKHGFSSQAYTPLMDPNETGYSHQQPYNLPPQQSYRDSSYTHESRMSHVSQPSPSADNSTYLPPVSTCPPPGMYGA